MRKKITVYLFFFILLLSGFYLGIFWGTDRWKKKLPSINEVKPFAFVNQNGDTINNRHVAGKVQVVEFFFTTCKGICPKMNTALLSIAEKKKEAEDFMILSHTVDPDTDSVARMKHFADSLRLNIKQWWLLTGTKEKLYEAARKSYLLDDQHDETAAIAEQFIHTQLFALVDRSGNVRGIYDGLDKKELKKLEEDIDLILNEGYDGPRFINGIFQNNPN
ncbi:MAG: SCO family protein [Bacteroidota bacterium]|jgi:protein SCO1/2